MSEVHSEAQEQEDEATLALLPSKSYQQAGRQAGRHSGRETVPGLRGAHTEMLNALDTPEKQLATGNKDTLIVLLRSICMREIMHSLCQKDIINSPTSALHLIEVII